MHFVETDRRTLFKPDFIFEDAINIENAFSDEAYSWYYDRDGAIM